MAAVDMSPAAIAARLRLAAELDRSSMPRPEVGLSSEAVSTRLEQALSLSTLCLRLMALG